MSIKPHHYTVEKKDGLWDCISESFSEGTLQDLKEKDIFDWCVKQSFEKGVPYLGALQKECEYGFYLSRWKRTYDRYFSKDMKLENFLSKRVRDRFEPKKTEKKTFGNEFSSGKFYSVASSSRFAVASFTKPKGGKLDYIESITIDGNEEDVVKPEFEHDTPVTGIKETSRCPQMDFFFKTKMRRTYFIEAKNHEIMDNHKSIELRASYKDTDAFKRLGLEGDPCEREYVDSKGKVHQYISLIKDEDDKKHFLQASDFGCKLKSFHFDFKQFLCHLMGIWSYAQNHPSEKIYFYYLIYRNKLYEEYDENLYNELEAEVKTVFKVFGKRFPEIHFELCYNDKYDTLTELNESIVDADEAKDKQEKWEVGFLFDHLGVTAYKKCESPDFTFDYEGKHIGLEHTRCFPSRKTIDNNSWRKIERKIEEELNKCELPPRYFHYCAQTHYEGRKNYKSIAEEIINGYKYMLENDIYDIGALGHEEYHLNRLTYLSYFPGYAPDHYIVSEITGGFETKADIKLILESVEKKEDKLFDYKELSKNNSIQEYWLAIFIPPEEYCIVESNPTLFLNSLYDRIYLINGRYIGALMQGDTSSIMRLK